MAKWGEIKCPRCEELEAKLAKAVEALKHIEHYDIHAPSHARTTLAQITGDKNHE